MDDFDDSAKTMEDLLDEMAEEGTPDTDRWAALAEVLRQMCLAQGINTNREIIE